MGKHPELYAKKPERDFTRNRKLNFNETVKLILSMRGNSLNNELYDYYNEHKVSLTASGFVQQRDKIKYECFEKVFHKFNSVCKDSKLYYGRRLFAIDGTVMNISRNPESETYMVTEQKPEGSNQLLINALYDLSNKTYADCVIQPRPSCDEREALHTMLKRLNHNEKILIIADRGYEGYNTFAHMDATRNVDYLIRVKQGNGAMREIQNLPMETLDVDVETTVTTSQTNEDKQNGYVYIQTASKKGKTRGPKTIVRKWDFASPYTFRFRVVRFKLSNGNYETIVTTLAREEFPLNVIRDLYHMRWGIETSFRDLKYSIGLVNIHSKKEEFIKQEIFSSLILYNYCERITGVVVVKQKVENIHLYQVNYSNAFFICKDFYRSNNRDGDTIIQKIGEKVLPIRSGRADKRKIRVKGVVSFLYRVA